jgi:hypothetical protein
MKRIEYIWSNRDLVKASLLAGALGFIFGVIVGFEWAYEPVKTTIRYLVG